MGGRNHLADGTVIGEDDYPPAVPGWPPMNGLTRPALHEILTSDDARLWRRRTRRA